MTEAITHGLSRQRVILATAGTMLALLLAALDQTIVGTAIPRIVADLNGLDRLAWVTTAYLVTSTTMTPIAGKLGDLFGRKPFLLVGMIGFVAASALCGLSPDMTQLTVALSIPRDHAWTSPQVTGLLALAAVMLASFIFVEGRVEHPIVPLHLFKNPTFSVSMIVGFLTAFGMFGSILFTPLVFQGILGISATNSGALITPMMFGLLGASTVTGFVMQRIRYYRFLGTLGVAVMTFGMWLLSQITPTVPAWHVVAGLIVVGLGLGVTFPLYLTAVQTALPREYLGVASSQIQFWRNLGGTVGSAILGAVLANRLPGYITTQVTQLHIPPQVLAGFPKGNANAILDPTTLAKLPAAFVSAIRLALSDTLHDIYLFAGAVLVLALISTVFMKEVPLTGARAGTAFDASPVEEPEPEAEESVVVGA